MPGKPRGVLDSTSPWEQGLGGIGGAVEPMYGKSGRGLSPACSMDPSACAVPGSGPACPTGEASGDLAEIWAVAFWSSPGKQ